MRNQNSKNNPFNAILRRYHKAIRRRDNLIRMNRNERRQAILARRIVQLRDKLLGFQQSFKRGVAATLVIGAAVLGAPNADAQITFGSQQINPYGLTSVPSGYYGNQSSPAFVDMDGDGDQDMLSTENYGSYYYYENTGSASSPSYAARAKNPFGLAAPQYPAQHPSFADMDGDGDFDLMVGKRKFQRTPDLFYYYENIGTATAPNFAAVQSNPFNINPAAFFPMNAPTMVDIDNDGDFDMTSVAWLGNWEFYENVGTASSPNFAAAVSNPFSLQPTVGAMTLSGVNYHSYGDMDNDGDLDIMAGSTFDGFFFLENVGTASAPSFAAPQVNPFGLPALWRSAPALVDLNNDGEIDMVSGSAYGHFSYFENTSGSAKWSHEEVGVQAFTVKTFPNPVVDQLQLEIVSDETVEARVRIMDAMGRILGNDELHPVQNGINRIKIDASQFASGTYFISVTTGENSYSSKFVK